jgi:cell division protein FtsB
MRRKKRAVSRFAAILLAGSLMVSAAMPAGAVTVDWDDLTDAQQEQAYHQLESENQALKEQMA